MNAANALVGLQIVWSNADPRNGVLELKSGVAPWNTAIAAGTIITFRVGDTESLGVNCDAGAGAIDTWIRADATNSAIVDDLGPDNFQTDNDDWQVQRFDGLGLPVQAAIGEDGSPLLWSGTGLGSDEVAKLQEDVPGAGAVWSEYVDGNCSSFGKANCWRPNTDAGTGAPTLQSIPDACL
jgi:hypothetical protein